MRQGRIPALTPREVLQVLQRAGFLIERQTGSHVALRNPLTRAKVTVPFHSRDLDKKTLFRIIRQSGLSRRQFLELL